MPNAPKNIIIKIFTSIKIYKNFHENVDKSMKKYRDYLQKYKESIISK